MPSLSRMKSAQTPSLNEVAVGLRGKVRGRILEQRQDLEAHRTGYGLDRLQQRAGALPIRHFA